MGSGEPPEFGLSRTMRLQKRGEFLRIREQGRRIAKGCLIANWTSLPPGSLPRLGVVTTKKLGKAHVRSRARRLLRETFRLHQHDLLEPVAMVLVARNSIVGLTQAQVERDYLSVLRQGRLLKTNE